MLTIYIDADGCVVTGEVYKVAERYQLSVFVVVTRELMQNLRHMGEVRCSPTPIQKRTREPALKCVPSSHLSIT